MVLQPKFIPIKSTNKIKHFKSVNKHDRERQWRAVKRCISSVHLTRMEDAPQAMPWGYSEPTDK